MELQFAQKLAGGVPIIAKRRVQFSRIDPAYARELFIRHALVNGEFDCRAPFVGHNAALIAEIARIEGCSPAAVKTRLHRARQRLRELLETDHG